MNMKKYWKQIVGAIILLLMVLVINKSIDNNKKHSTQKMDDSAQEVKGTIHGTVTAVYEGEHTLDYRLVLADNATTSLEKDNRLLKIVSASTTKPLYYYFSYEGGRGYTANDYITNVLAKSVQIVKTESMTHVNNDWTVARSANSSWHIANFGEWLVVVENSNADKDIATASISSFKIENDMQKSSATSTNMDDRLPMFKENMRHNNDMPMIKENMNDKVKVPANGMKAASDTMHETTRMATTSASATKEMY